MLLGVRDLFKCGLRSADRLRLMTSMGSMPEMNSGLIVNVEGPREIRKNVQLEWHVTLRETAES